MPTICCGTRISLINILQLLQLTIPTDQVTSTSFVYLLMLKVLMSLPFVITKLSTCYKQCKVKSALIKYLVLLQVYLICHFSLVSYLLNLTPVPKNACPESLASTDLINVQYVTDECGRIQHIVTGLSSSTHDKTAASWSICLCQCAAWWIYSSR